MWDSRTKDAPATLACSGGARKFFGGHWGGKMHIWRVKNLKKSPEWLILAIFSSWLGESGGGGRASDRGGGANAPLDATTPGLHRDALGQHITHSLSGVKKETLLIPKCEFLFSWWFQIWHWNIEIWNKKLQNKRLSKRKDMFLVPFRPLFLKILQLSFYFVNFHL